MGGSGNLKGQLLAVLPEKKLLNNTCYSKVCTNVDEAQEMYNEVIARQVGRLDTHIQVNQYISGFRMHNSIHCFRFVSDLEEVLESCSSRWIHGQLRKNPPKYPDWVKRSKTVHNGLKNGEKRQIEGIPAGRAPRGKMTHERPATAGDATV